MSTSPSKINSIDDIDDGLEFFDIPEEAPDSGPAELPSPQAAPAPLSPDGMEMPETQPPHPSMSGASSVDVGADPVYSKWVPDIRDPLKPLKAFRGPWKRPVRIASLFGGLGSERQVLKVFEVPTETILSCDKKKPAVAFQERHHKRGEHHMLDATDLLEPGNDNLQFRCLYHLFGMCALSAILPMLIDILFVSTSCCPFSRARTGRAQGTQSHDDIKCIEAFWLALSMLLPIACIFEQVVGFGLQESLRDPFSPLDKFLAKLKKDFPQYRIVVFFAEGSLWLALLRHRIYVIMVHTDAGGQEVVDALIEYVKAHGHFPCSS